MIDVLAEAAVWSVAYSVGDLSLFYSGGEFDYPFGGFKDSGLGREGDFGDADLMAFTETQTIRVATRDS